MQEPFSSPAANANRLPHQINENCLPDNKKVWVVFVLLWVFFLRKLVLKYIMLPILFPGIYRIWGHLLTGGKMLLPLQALKFTSSYTELKYSKDGSFLSKVD